MAAKRIKGIGAGLIKHAPWMGVVLAIYQYYKDAGGFQGFLYDIKNINMDVLQGQWTKVAMAVAFFVGADVIARYVPGNMRYIVKAVMYYFGASQILSVLQGMYYAPAAAAAAKANGGYTEVRGY